MTTQNLAKNQVVITQDNGEKFFLSYNTLIAKVNTDQEVILSEKYWNYSRTTTRYLGQFLGTSGVAEIRTKIESGEYKVKELKA